MNTLMFFRILTVYPLLCFIVRLVLFFLIFKYFFSVQNSLLFFNDDWPGYRLIAVKNIIIVTAGCLSSIFYDRVSFMLDSFCPGQVTANFFSAVKIIQIGDIIRYTGTLCAAILMYLLPCLIRMIDDKKETGRYRLHIWIFHVVWALHFTYSRIFFCQFFQTLGLELQFFSKLCKE